MGKIKEKLQELAEEFGYEDILELMDNVINDSVCPSICMNEECDFTTEYEPDQDRGWCEVCEKNSVKSAMILLGVI